MKGSEKYVGKFQFVAKFWIEKQKFGELSFCNLTVLTYPGYTSRLTPARAGQRLRPRRHFECRNG